MAKKIYLDYASLTPIDKGVIKEMNKYSKSEYGNPSALYESAVNAKNALKNAKEAVARVIHAHSDEIIFTSGGTESNHIVLNKFENKNILVSNIEHSSIIKRESIVKVEVNKNGLVDLDLFKKCLNENKNIKLVSIMYVNNEIGTIQPIHDIAKIIRDYRKANNSQYPLFHTDACQAGIHLPLYVEKLGIDIMTLDGAKIYGPRGVGMLYIKRGVEKIIGKIHREGTENIPGIMGFACALNVAEKMREKETLRVAELKEYFLSGLYKINKDIKVNGEIDNTVGNFSPHILNVGIPNIDNEFFVLQLDAQGIECSTKSACLTDIDDSYVLQAIGVESKNAVRFSFGRGTGKGELKKVLGVIEGVLGKVTR